MASLKYHLLAGTAVIAIVGASAASSNADPAPSRIKIASSSVRANGCHDTSQTFTTQVPNIDRLDRSYHGVLDGIGVQENGNNGHAYKNFAWVNNGTAISYELYAKGAGYWVDPPKVFGTKIGGGYCHNAAGGSEAVDIYAYYK